jgi:CheY-like chemotaxis protein
MYTKKIIVSDVPDLVSVLEESFFQREGFELIRVVESDEAFRLIDADSPALAVLDLPSLGDQGIECCHRVKSDPLLQGTPVMMVLDHDPAVGQKDHCLLAGCDHILERPVSALQMIDDACSLLGLSRRLTRRFPVTFNLEFSLHENKKYVGTVTNLNPGGMFLACEAIYPIDTCLSLEFTLPGFKMPLHCTARVVWVNHSEWIKKEYLPCGMGLEFMDLSEFTKRAVREFLYMQPSD